MTHGQSKTHLWGQLPENYITLNPYNFYRLSRNWKDNYSYQLGGMSGVLGQVELALNYYRAL